MADSKAIAVRGLQEASDLAKLGRKPLNLWPGEQWKVRLDQLPELHFTVHPGFIIVNNIYLESTPYGFDLDDIRHLLAPGRFYAVTDRQKSYVRVTEYLSESDYRKLGNPYNLSDINTEKGAY